MQKYVKSIVHKRIVIFFNLVSLKLVDDKIYLENSSLLESSSAVISREKLRSENGKLFYILILLTILITNFTEEKRVSLLRDLVHKEKRKDA